MRAAVVSAVVVAVNAAVWIPVWWLTKNPIDASAIPIEQTSGKALAGRGASPGEALELDFSELVPVHSYSRPLFAKDRKPWQPPKQPAAKRPAAEQVEKQAPPPAKPPSVRLVGVSISDNTSSRALLRPEVEVEPIWVFEGDDLAGWKVSKIHLQSVDLQRGGRTVSIDLYPEDGAAQ